MTTQQQPVCATCGADLDDDNHIVIQTCPKCGGEMCDFCYTGTNTKCVRCENTDDEDEEEE